MEMEAVMSGDVADGMPPPDCTQVCGVGAVRAPTALVVTKMCSTCDRPKPVDQFSGMYVSATLRADRLSSVAARAQKTCRACVAKKKRQHARKRQSTLDKTDNLYGENQQFSGVIANQQKELERLRSALNVLSGGRTGGRVPEQVLNQLHADPSDTAAISILLGSRAPDSNSQEKEQAVAPSSHVQSGVTEPLQNPGTALQQTDSDFRATTAGVAYEMNTAGDAAAVSTCSPSDSGKRIHSSGSSHINLERQKPKRKKSTNLNLQVQGDSTYLDYDLDPDIFEVPTGVVVEMNTGADDDIDLDLFEVPFLDACISTAYGSGTGSGTTLLGEGGVKPENPRPLLGLQSVSAWILYLLIPVTMGYTCSWPMGQAHIYAIGEQLLASSLRTAGATPLSVKIAPIAICLMCAMLSPSQWRPTYMNKFSLQDQGDAADRIRTYSTYLFFIVLGASHTVHPYGDQNPGTALQTSVWLACTLAMVSGFPHRYAVLLRACVFLFIIPRMSLPPNWDKLWDFPVTGFVLNLSLVDHLVETFWLILWLYGVGSANNVEYLCFIVAGCICTAIKIWCLQNLTRNSTSKQFEQETDEDET